MEAESQLLAGKVEQSSGKSGLIGIGAVTLLVSITFCAASHLILRGAASAGAGGNVFGLLFDPKIIGGLILYGSGTVLWIFCLSRLDLSVAYPASALQLLLVYAGARWFLGEEIPLLRLIGAAVILSGIALLFVEGRRRHHA